MIAIRKMINKRGGTSLTVSRGVFAKGEVELL